MIVAIRGAVVVTKRGEERLDVKIAEELIVKYFNPKKIRLNFITRSAG